MKPLKVYKVDINFTLFKIPIDRRLQRYPGPTLGEAPETTPV